MIYKDFQGKKLSALGMGCMRLPVIDKDDTNINADLVKEMFACAMKNGINYFDTAWGYHGGNSEIVVGEALKSYARESFYLADKFPGYDVANMDKVEQIFEEQLKKCGVEYFDYYLNFDLEITMENKRFIDEILKNLNINFSITLGNGKIIKE